MTQSFIGSDKSPESLYFATEHSLPAEARFFLLSEIGGESINRSMMRCYAVSRTPHNTLEMRGEKFLSRYRRRCRRLILNASRRFDVTINCNVLIWERCAEAPGQCNDKSTSLFTLDSAWMGLVPGSE